MGDDEKKEEKGVPMDAKIKANVKDAWEGEWLTPENFTKLPRNENSKKKKKVKNVEAVKNLDSSVAVITIDTAMQRCMVNMGLRVMSTQKDRQFGGSDAVKNGGDDNNKKEKGNAHNNGEP